MGKNYAVLGNFISNTTNHFIQGMVDAAQYIYRKLKDEHLLTKAFTWDRERDTHNFNIVCVGHSLGAGAAAILAIMLRYISLFEI